MIKRVVDFALNNRFIILIAAVLLFGWGANFFQTLVALSCISIAILWLGLHRI